MVYNITRHTSLVHTPLYPAGLRSLQLMRSHLTRAPNPPPIIIQHKRNRQKRHAQKPQQATRPRDPQLVVHGVCEKRKRRPNRTPHQVVARIHRGDVFRVRVTEVREHGHEEQKGTHAEEGATDDGHDPVDRGARGPAEPEEADGDEEGADEGGLEADFGAEEPLLVELRFDVFVVVEEEGDHDDEGPDEDAEEGETFGPEREIVYPDEDYREAFEPEVEQSVDERQVEVQKKADGLCESEGEGPDEDHQPNLFS